MRSPTTVSIESPEENPRAHATGGITPRSRLRGIFRWIMMLAIAALVSGGAAYVAFAKGPT